MSFSMSEWQSRPVRRVLQPASHLCRSARAGRGDRCGVRRIPAVSEFRHHRDRRRHARFHPKGARRCGLGAADAGRRHGAVAGRETRRPYYIRQKQKPIVLLAVDSGDGKVKVEIKVAPFAEPQNLEADQEIFGLPSPKPHKTAGGTRSNPAVRDGAGRCRSRAGVLSARAGGQELPGESKRGIKPEQTLNFTTTDGTAVLKLGRKYDPTLVSLVQQLRSRSPSQVK